MAFRLFLGNVPAGGAPAEITGTLSGTEGADVAAFTGDVIVQGSLAATEGADAAAFTGDVIVQGTLSGVEGADAAALTGAVVVQGTLAATEGADSGAFTGGVLVQGQLSASEGADTSASTGLVIVQGAAGTIEGADTASLTGGVLVQGALAATEGADDAALTGVVVSAEITGAIAATDGADTAGFTGNAGVVQSLTGGGLFIPIPIEGSGDGVLPSLLALAIGQVGVSGYARAKLPRLKAKGSGEGNVAKFIPMPFVAGAGVIGVSGTGNVVKITVAGKSKGQAGLVGKASGTLSMCAGRGIADHDPDEAVITALLMVA